MSSNWRDQAPTGREQFHYVFQNNLFSDVRFLVGSEQTPVYSHSFVLKVRSAVFEKILEKLHGPIQEIVINGVTISGFNRFIQFLYTDQLEASAEEALEILPLAKKYRVSALSKQCVTLLAEGIRESNAASIYNVARDLKEIELEQKALQFIQNNASQVFAGKDFLHLNNDNLSQLLKMDELDITEINLFNALMEWANVECGRHTLRATPKHMRMVIKDALYLIRFPIMSLSEFNADVVSKEILNEKEIKEVTKYLETDLTDREFVKPTLFSSMARNLLHEDQIDLSKTDDDAHKRLAKLAILKSNPSPSSVPLIVTSLILEIEPKSDVIDLEELKTEIGKIKKYGLFWGASNAVELPNGKQKFRISFAADTRRSYGVGTVVEAVLDLENYVSQVFVHSFKDEIVVRV
ncbi:BTB/POZ domain-containing protein 2 [Orchesella cincta]|uniref:BTB/POZ domain-containing protein 2 n=1 Tax=Orchesella cincta TaxID=48709 RepID=A0A1D2N9V6_ORCCI|nr:BTB/POZ domain-containing protein 2 [Orchesella cincta]